MKIFINNKENIVHAHFLPTNKFGKNALGEQKWAEKMKSFLIVLIWMIFVVLPQNTKHTIFTTS